MRNNSYLADFHAHCRWSPDAHYSMEEMALAAAERGVEELCFTDHADVKHAGNTEFTVLDFDALRREFASARAAVGDRIKLRLGMELGAAVRSFEYAQYLLDSLPEKDFVIGSNHQLSARWGYEDLYTAAAREDGKARRQIEDYLEQVLLLARWGRFSVLGHLTLPLRYLNENNGLHMSFDGFEAEVAEIFRALLDNGCGIELNVNRGHTPLPDAKWLRMYREEGGEIITLGSDAHSPKYSGAFIREGQELLRSCGYTAFCTFERMQPVFHDL